jgi:hypothetical protein
MKFARMMAAALILVMATTPALAAACAASCAMRSLSMASADDGSTSMAADHCQHAAPEQNQHQPQTDAKGCAMAAGCHYAQAMSITPSAQIFLPDLTSTALPHFSLSATGADLPPPIKPPA